MNFEPTNNYYGTDLTEEKNAALWHFWEFCKTLVALSSEPEVQRDIIGSGDVASELAMDFETNYSSQKNGYLKHQFLSSKNIAELDALDKYLEQRSDHRFAEFWNDASLDSHPDWEQVRVMAKNILENMNYHELTIEVERVAEEVDSNSGKRIVIETTKTYLVRKTNE